MVAVIFSFVENAVRLRYDTLNLLQYNMERDVLKNEVIVVTGATSGFGEACARMAYQQGATVVAVGRREERLNDLARDCGDADRFYPIVLDVRNRDDVFLKLRDEPVFPPPTVLVNNAGLALGLAPAHEADLDEWENMVDANIKGVMYCTKALLSGFVERNCGYILNVGSVAGTYPYPGANTYGATKAFVRQFTLNLKADLLGTAVRVTNLEPGMADTEFSLVRFGGDQQRAKNVYEGTQSIAAEDIAETIMWCISRPAHININSMEIMPTCQAFAGFPVSRTEKGEG